MVDGKHYNVKFKGKITIRGLIAISQGLSFESYIMVKYITSLG